MGAGNVFEEGEEETQDKKDNGDDCCLDELRFFGKSGSRLFKLLISLFELFFVLRRRHVPYYKGRQGLQGRVKEINMIG